MDFEEWEPVYVALLADFGYDRGRDEWARDELAALIDDASTYPTDELRRSRSTVAIAGAAPSLAEEIPLARRADAVFAASTAADRLSDAGVAVDCVVTDLDKHADSVPDVTHDGTPVAVHAHGDNVDLLRKTIPACDPAYLIPTTQAAPAGPVRNFGGFTDGDRAAFLADHLGASSLVFPGWEFDDPSVDANKAKKLAWAERLLHWLERRRGDQFAILDGRRESIDTTGIPVG